MSTPDHSDLDGVLAEFDGPDALIAGSRAVRDAGFKQWDAFSPFPVHGLDPAMGIKLTILPLLVFGAGATGLIGGLALQWWTNAYDWPWLVSGKPFFSLPANIPVAFETTVLLAGVGCFLMMWGLNRLPRFVHPFFKGERFERVTTDGFFIGIEAGDKKFDREQVVALLEKAGATRVEVIHAGGATSDKIPRPLMTFIGVTVVAAIIPFALVARARVKRSEKPHIHVIPDMDFQFKYKAQDASVLFVDGRADRPQVDGTVARGQLKADSHFYRGLVAAPDGGDGEAWATTFPVGDQFKIDTATMARGRQRFNIYCSPCHGTAGHGDGVVDKRAKEVENTWSPPTSLHMEHIVRQPHGQLFNTITNGIRTMQGYGDQLTEHDRWALILYIRALQRSQLTVPDDAKGAELPPAEGKK